MSNGTDKPEIAVVKFGTAIVTKPSGAFHWALMGDMAKVMSHSIDSGRRIAVITSGAVGLGRPMIDQSERLEIEDETIAYKQILAGFGQGELIKEWSLSFAPRKVAQFLVTHRQFKGKEREQLQLNCLEALRLGVPVWNENDLVTGEEFAPDGSALGFSDNSELAWMVADLLEAEKLIYLSNVEGLLDERGELVRELSIGCQVAEFGSGNSLGRGGMSKTVEYAWQAMEAGIEVHIADGRTPEDLRRILLTDECPPGTYGAPVRRRS